MSNAGFGPVEKTLCAVIVPQIRSDMAGSEIVTSAIDGKTQYGRTAEAQLEEASGLAEAISLKIVYTDIANVKVPRPSTLLMGGKVEQLKTTFAEMHVVVAIVDHPLTPVQQRNLEKAWNVKVLDRTGLILEIFGARARTKEGRLQVELAALRYQRGRLVRSWTHLERQRGGAGFLGGPGETQIESDRRQLQTKIERLEKQLQQVRNRRELHRKMRKKNAIPVVAFVGYTNAGKSTLFNRITEANVFAKDLLFATLDPTLRRIELSQNLPIILSDTVGFISNLPTDLVASFRATLEEVTEADIVVHVRDISHDDTIAQAHDVEKILKDLDVKMEDDPDSEDNSQTVIEVWNKIDRLSDDRLTVLRNQSQRPGGLEIAMISAQTGDGVDDLLSLIEKILTRGQATKKITLEAAELASLHHFYNLGTVLERSDNEDGSVSLNVRSDSWKKLDQYLKKS